MMNSVIDEKFVALVAELKKTKDKLAAAEKEVLRLERLHANANNYNEDLRHQLETLNSQLHSFKTASACTPIKTFTDASTEYDELDCPMHFQSYEEDDTAKDPTNLAIDIKDENDKSSGDYLQFPSFSDEWMVSVQNSGESLSNQIREISESAVAQSGFVYDPQTKMYYDYNSGYYYDAEKSLYYEPYSGAYYTFDCPSQSYQFHSQISHSNYSTLSHIIFNRYNAEQPEAYQEQGKDTDVSEVVNGLSNLSLNLLRNQAIALDLQVQYITPCIRVIVKSSEHLQVGKLYVITYTNGATVGRDETLNHLIHIPDPLVSKMHCEITYCDALQRYTIKDCASQCGTFVNGKRLSETKVISNPCTLYNGDKMQINNTVFELHIHPGHDTCMDCEPGNLQIAVPLKAPNVTSKEDKEEGRRQQLKAIKKKYGLKNVSYEVGRMPSDKSKYEDKAAKRRSTVGSDNPHEKDSPAASVHRAINSENVGHKMLSKMGWKEGEGLGKSRPGIKEPIQINLRLNAVAGLGSYGNSCSPDDMLQVHLAQKWIKAQKRYNESVHWTDIDSKEEKVSDNDDDKK